MAFTISPIYLKIFFHDLTGSHLGLSIPNVEFYNIMESIDCGKFEDTISNRLQRAMNTFSQMVQKGVPE